MVKSYAFFTGLFLVNQSIFGGICASKDQDKKNDQRVGRPVEGWGDDNNLYFHSSGQQRRDAIRPNQNGQSIHPVRHLDSQVGHSGGETPFSRRVSQEHFSSAIFSENQ